MEFPRFVHRFGGLSQLVHSAEAHAAALADGWSAAPVPMPVEKDGERLDLYTANALETALAQGWSVVAPSTSTVAATVVTVTSLDQNGSASCRRAGPMFTQSLAAKGRKK